jgi:hypothetical protein
MTTSQLENCVAAEQDYNNCQAHISLRVRHHLSLRVRHHLSFHRCMELQNAVVRLKAVD